MAQKYDFNGMLCVGRDLLLPDNASYVPGKANIKLYRNGGDTIDDVLGIERSRAFGHQRSITGTKLGNRLVQGTVPFQCPVEDIWPFLSSAMGTGAVSGGTPYLHTFKRSSTAYKSLTFGRVQDDGGLVEHED